MRIVIISLVLALILSVIPMPASLIWLRANLVFLVFLYWVLTFPDYFNVGFAFILGIITDLLTASVLGKHAFSWVLIAYLISRFQRQINRFILIKNTIVVALLLVINTVVIFCIQSLTGQAASLLDIQQATIGVLWSMLAWFVILLLLTYCCYRFQCLKKFMADPM